MSKLSSPAKTPLPPFRGNPYTKARFDKSGNMRITVHATGLKPLWVKLSLYGATGTSLCLFGLTGAEWVYQGLFDFNDLAELTGIAIGTFPLTLIGIRQIVKSRVTILFTPAQIVISRFFGWRTFDRAHPHGFVLLPHDKMPQEKEAHAFLDRKHRPKWWSLKRKTYYAKSHHIALTCFGERHDIITIYGTQKATAVQARLQACDTLMDGADFGESGIALSPQEDWRIDSGGL